jgi:hypothetical protein
MGYLQEVDRWLDVILTDLADGKMNYADVKRDIRSRILESYKNGLKPQGNPLPRARAGKPAGFRSGRKQLNNRIVLVAQRAERLKAIPAQLARGSLPCGRRAKPG